MTIQNTKLWAADSTPFMIFLVPTFDSPNPQKGKGQTSGGKNSNDIADSGRPYRENPD